MWLYVADSAVKRVLEWENSDVWYITTDKNAIFPEASEEDYSFSYTWADQHWTAPFSWKLTIECKWAWSNNANWWYAKWTISVTKWQKFSIMVWWYWGRTNDWTTYWFGWSTTYGWRWWWGLSWVFTWEETITDSQASRVVIIAWWAWWGRTWGWAWGWESWQNWNGGSYWFAWGWWTQTAKWSWNQAWWQFHWWGWSWTYWFWWWGWWYWWGGSWWDGSWDDDCQAGWGSGHCSSKMTQTTLTVGWWAAANTDWSISFHLESKIIIPTPAKVTSAWVYHNPDLWLISMSADWENRITISDKNVWAWSNDIENESSYGWYFQFGNIHWFWVLPEPTPWPRLPIEYQEVEYIESTGTQWINWLRLPVDFKFTITAQFESTTQYYNVYDTTEVRPMLWVYTNWRFELNIDNMTAAWTIDNSKFITVISDALWSTNKLLVDWTQVAEWTKISSISKDTTLFHRGASDGFKWKIKYVLIEGTGWKIRELVPCYRRMDWAVWMYDLVNNQFYANAWSWTFWKWWEINTPVLPEEYMEVEYLESVCSWQWATSSWQIIDTLFVPTNKTRVWFKMSWWTQSWTSNQFFWEDVNWTQWDWGFSIVTDNYSYNWPASNRPTWFNDWTVHHWTMWFDWVYRDWTLVDNSRSWQALNATQTISLFWLHRNWAYVEHSSCKIHYFIIEEDWAWVRFFMPCYRKLDNKPWMYDLINKEFYTNSWTGEFTKWPDVYSIE